MEEITINVTLKLHKSEVINFENWLRKNIEVIDFTHLPDTEQLYLNDPIFKKLVKQKKDLQRTTWEYIMKNNHKYNEAT